MSTPQSSPTRRALIWALPVVIILVAIALVALSLTGKSKPQANEPAPTSATDAQQTPEAEAQPNEPEEVTVDEYVEVLMQNRGPDLSRRIADEPGSFGEVEAPVTMVVYSDYQCKFCSLWTQQTMTVLMSEYVDQGKLRIELRDVNVFGEPSRQAALAAHAAEKQGQFWQMHQAMFPDGATLPADQLTAESLTGLAGELGMDTDQFATDMSSEEVVASVTQNEAEGQSIGVSSTPSFLINGIPMTGAQPANVFTAIIDAELALVQ